MVAVEQPPTHPTSNKHLQLCELWSLRRKSARRISLKVLNCGITSFESRGPCGYVHRSLRHQQQRALLQKQINHLSVNVCKNPPRNGTPSKRFRAGSKEATQEQGSSVSPWSQGKVMSCGSSRRPKWSLLNLQAKGRNIHEARPFLEEFLQVQGHQL